MKRVYIDIIIQTYDRRQEWRTLVLHATALNNNKSQEEFENNNRFVYCDKISHTSTAHLTNLLNNKYVPIISNTNHIHSSLSNCNKRSINKIFVISLVINYKLNG